MTTWERIALRAERQLQSFPRSACYDEVEIDREVWER